MCKAYFYAVQGELKGDGFCEDEIVADAAKKINGSYSQMLKVLDEHPTFGKQLGDKMIELYQNILGANKTSRDNIFDSAEAQSIEKAAKLWMQAMQEKGIETPAGVDNADGEVYNSYDYFSQMPYNEKRQLEEYIISKNNRTGQKFKTVDCTEIGNHFYVWKNNGKYDYTVSEMIEIEGNEDIIEL